MGSRVSGPDDPDPDKWKKTDGHIKPSHIKKTKLPTFQVKYLKFTVGLVVNDNRKHPKKLNKNKYKISKK